MENKIKEIKDKKHIVRKPRSTKDYVVGATFQKALVEYYDECELENKVISKKDGNMPPSYSSSFNYIGQCIMKIANNLSTKVNFSGFSFKEDMVGDAQEKMLEAVVYQKYDTLQSNNPVGYFTQIAWNAFLQRIHKEKRENYIKHKTFEEMYNELEKDLLDDLKPHMPNNEAHSKVISDFEKPKEKSTGYAIHRNLSYSKNRKEKVESEKIEEKA